MVFPGPFLQVLGEEGQHRGIGLLLRFAAEVVEGILQLQKFDLGTDFPQLLRIIPRLLDGPLPLRRVGAASGRADVIALAWA
jgi:hypothetical protein